MGVSFLPEQATAVRTEIGGRRCTQMKSCLEGPRERFSSTAKAKDVTGSLFRCRTKGGLPPSWALISVMQVYQTFPLERKLHRS